MKENMRNRSEDMINQNQEQRRDMGAREEMPLNREKDCARNNMGEDAHKQRDI